MAEALFHHRRLFDTVAVMLRKIFHTVLLIVASLFPVINPLVQSIVAKAPGWELLPALGRGTEAAGVGRSLHARLWPMRTTLQLITATCGAWWRP